jgi:hypothetical protein
MLTIFFKRYLLVLSVICSFYYLLALYPFFLAAGKMELKTRKKQNKNCTLKPSETDFQWLIITNGIEHKPLT